jgi:hypothetical protein
MSNKKIADQKFTSYSAGKLAFGLCVNAPASSLRKGLDQKGTSLRDTNLGHVIKIFDNIKLHARDPKRYNDALNHILDKATNDGSDLSALKKAIDGNNGSRDARKNLATILDYHVSNGHTAGINGKLGQGQEFSRLRDMFESGGLGTTNGGVGMTVSTSQNPKAMQEFAEKNFPATKGALDKLYDPTNIIHN